MNEDSIVKVLIDYKKIANSHDWLKEVKSAETAINDYRKTVKDLVESQRYSRQAAMMIESLMVEIEEGKIYIYELEEEIKYLNQFVQQLMEKLNELMHGEEENAQPIPK